MHACIRYMRAWPRIHASIHHLLLPGQLRAEPAVRVRARCGAAVLPLPLERDRLHAARAAPAAALPAGKRAQGAAGLLQRGARVPAATAGRVGGARGRSHPARAQRVRALRAARAAGGDAPPAARARPRATAGLPRL
eukprot:scaffold63790_cov70-Phaeocystis_antarctica.AAC.6